MSTLRLTTISNQTGSSSVPSETVINGSAKAWVNFNGTGTVAIRASFNVSSITDNGTGDYTVNFTTAMTDANYSAFISGNKGAANTGQWMYTGNGADPTTTTLRLLTVNSAFNAVDSGFVYVGVFR
jgi:hypothetical protein